MSNLTVQATVELIDRMTAPMRNMAYQAERLNQTFRNTNQQISAFNQNVANINAMNQTLQRSNTNFQKMRSHVKGVAQDLNNVFKGIATVQRKADGLAQSFANTRKELRQQAVNSAMKLGAAGMMGYQMIKPAIDFDKQMSANQAVLELQKGSADLLKLRNQAISEGARSAYSATQAAQAQYELAAGGFNTKQVFESLAGTLNLAAAGQVELAEAAQIAVGTLNGFGLQANQISRMNDVMVGTVNKSAVGISDLGEAMKYAAPIAKLYGASLEQTSAMIGLLGNSNIKGSEAGTGLRSIMGRLAAPPKNAAASLQLLKINPVSKDGTMRDISDVFAEIKLKTAELNADERIDIFKDIAGEEHFSKFAVLVDNASMLDKSTGKTANNIKILTEQLEKSSGLADKVANIQMDNLAGDIDQLKGAWESLSIAMGGDGGVINNTLRNLVSGFTDMINRVTAWVQANPQLVRTIGELALKFIKINIAIWSLKYAFALVFGTFFSMLSHFIKFGAVMMLVNAILARFGITFWGKFRLMGQAVMMFARLFGQAFMFLARQSIPFVITAIGQLATVLLTTPIGWAVMAIAVAALLIFKYWAPIKAFFTGFWQGFITGLAPLISTLSSLWSMLGQIFAPLRPVIDAIVAGIQWLVQGFMSLFTPVQMTSGQLAGITASGQSFGMVLGTIVGLIGQVVAGLVGALALGFQVIGTAIGTFAGMVVNYGGMAINYIASLPSRIMAFLSGLPAQMAAMGSQIMTGLKNGIMNSANAVLDGIKSVANRIKSAFTGLMGIHSPSRIFMSYGGHLMTGLANGITGNANLPLSATTALAGQISDQAPLGFDTRATVLPSRGMGGSSSMGGIGYASGGITININGAGDPQAVAREVERVLSQRERNMAARNRSRLADID